MKKRVVSLVTALLLAVSLCVPAIAAGFEEAWLDFVTDVAGSLSEEEWSEL